MLEESQVEFLIIGGGLSGLMSAYFLNDKDFLILEKEDKLGGYCKTLDNKNFVWDYAGHFFHFRTEKFKKLFHSLVEADEIIYNQKNTKIFYKGKLIDYPFQTNIHELEKSEFIECLYDLYTKNSDAQYDNFLDMLYAKFGKAITEKFLRPYNEKLYATDLNKLDKDAMGRFFPYANLDQIIANMNPEAQHQKTYNDEFMYLRKGTGYFLNKIIAKLPQEKILCNQNVIQIDAKNKYVVTQQGKKIYYKHLINSLPFNYTMEILAQDKPAHQLSQQLSYNQVLVLNLGFDQASPNYKKEHWVYFPDKKLNFYRVGFYNNILHKEKLSVYVEIGFKPNEKINVEQELKKTLEGMAQVGIINKTMQPCDSAALIMSPAYVHINQDSDNLVKQKIHDLKSQQIYCLGRYGVWTYNSMEDCMEMANNIIERITK